MINPSYLNILRKICTRLGGTTVNWVVTGSFGFALQGVPIEPNDIDIQKTKREIMKLKVSSVSSLLNPLGFPPLRKSAHILER